MTPRANSTVGKISKLIFPLSLLFFLASFYSGYPVITFFSNDSDPIKSGTTNLGGVNASGQIAFIEGLPELIDPETPQDVLTRTGFDGKQYQLVFSDEFNQDGRSFYPGDDP